VSTRARSPAACGATCALLLLAACAPPESRRVQGGGRGADIGNRSAIVEMHGGSVIYPDERCAVRGDDCAGPLPASGRAATADLGVSEHVLEHMGRGGQIRRVIYEPPPDLARPEREQIEPPFPGPGTGDAPVPPEPEPAAAPASPPSDEQ
jgi:hypothetical protein